MRTTLSGYYRNLAYDSNNTAKALFDVTKQISSGQKIQYGYEDTAVFVNTLRLDNEITTLTQSKETSQKALQFSTNTDTTMSEMSKILDAMKVKMIAASTESNSPSSLKAIAAELRGLENNLKQLANTSIDGKYLFSGSATGLKPISADGTYKGNEQDIKAFISSGVQQTYNINGEDLFLGSENDIRRKVSLNIPQYNQSLLHPNVMDGVDTAPKEEFIQETDSIRDLMGDNDSEADTINAKHNFYIRGVKNDGTSFKEIISFKDTDKMSDLLDQIGKAYGNTSTQDLVNVTLNANGQIEIEDKLKGSSKLDFHMTASTSMSFNPSIKSSVGVDATTTGIGNPLAGTAPIAPLTDASRISVPVGSVASGEIKAGDTISIRGNIYTVANPAIAQTPYAQDATLEVISFTENIQGSPLSNVEIFKTTGEDISNKPAVSFEPTALMVNNINSAILPSNAVEVTTGVLTSVGQQIDINGTTYSVTALSVGTGTNGDDQVTLSAAINYNFSDVEALDADTSYEYNKFGVPTKDFMNSNFVEYSEIMNQEVDRFNSDTFFLSGEFITKDGKEATEATLLSEIFRSDVKSIDLTGFDVNGNTPSPSVFNFTATSTVKDLVSAIQESYENKDLVGTPGVDESSDETLDVYFEDSRIKFNRTTKFEFESNADAKKDFDNVINISNFGRNYTPKVGDVVKIEGDPIPYTIASVYNPTAPTPPAINNGDIELNRTLFQDMTAGAKVSIELSSTDPIFDLDIQLEAYDTNGATGKRIDGLTSARSLTYDESNFSKDRNVITSNTSQISRLDNSYATDKTTLLEVAGLNTFGTTSPTVLNSKGVDVDGNAFEININLTNDISSTPPTTIPPTAPATFIYPGAYFSVTKENPVTNENETIHYPIYDPKFIDSIGTGTYNPGYDLENPTKGDDVTYKQYMDIINMVVTNNLPDSSVNLTPPTLPGQPAPTLNVPLTDYTEYFNAIASSSADGKTALDLKGRIIFEELNTTTTKAEFTIYDENSSDFNKSSSVMQFNSNNSLEISDTKTDFFAQIDEMISAVETGRLRADGSAEDPRNIGIQNALSLIDDVSEHLFNQHSIAGVQSQTLQNTVDRTDLLILTTQTLRSETLDVDFAEAALELKQLELNYQAALSSVSRITQLSLVNFL